MPPGILDWFADKYIAGVKSSQPKASDKPGGKIASPMTPQVRSAPPKAPDKPKDPNYSSPLNLGKLAQKATDTVSKGGGN